MVSKRAYKRVKVNAVDREKLKLMALSYKEASLGLDNAKNEIVACLRWCNSEFERPWSVVNPFGIKELVELCSYLVSLGIKLTVAMESTGTYGEGIRRALTMAQLEVVRVSGKHVSDYKEIFDGVPSQHDGKDAAMIAELAAMGKGAAWPFVALGESMEEIRYQVRRMDTFQSEKVQWVGRLEAEVTRFWPELTRCLKLGSLTTLRLLSHYGSPAEAVKDRELCGQLKRWGRSKLTKAKIDQIIESASSTVGVPMSSPNIAWMKEISQRCLKAHLEVRQCDRNIRDLLDKDPFWSRYASVVGAGTLGVILTSVGDPREYPNGGSLLKAVGMNLKERSSGKRIGEKAITKRGPSIARRWLFFWALRAIQREELKAWYERFCSDSTRAKDRPTAYRRMKGVICMMRKLIRSLRKCVGEGIDFEYTKVIGESPKPKRRRRRSSKKKDASY